MKISQMLILFCLSLCSISELLEAQQQEPVRAEDKTRSASHQVEGVVGSLESRLLVVEQVLGIGDSNNNIDINAQGGLTLSGDEDVAILSDGDSSIQSGGNVVITAESAIGLRAFHEGFELIAAGDVSVESNETITLMSGTDVVFVANNSTISLIHLLAHYMKSLLYNYQPAFNNYHSTITFKTVEAFDVDGISTTNDFDNEGVGTNLVMTYDSTIPGITFTNSSSNITVDGSSPGGSTLSLGGPNVLLKITSGPAVNSFILIVWDQNGLITVNVYGGA